MEKSEIEKMPTDLIEHLLGPYGPTMLAGDAKELERELDRRTTAEAEVQKPESD